MPESGMNRRRSPNRGCIAGTGERAHSVIISVIIYADMTRGCVVSSCYLLGR